MTKCKCGMKESCDYEWGPDCDLGSNPEFVSAVWDFKAPDPRWAILSLDVNENEPEDFRAFLRYRDEDGEEWEIRGYGSTKPKAHRDAIKRFEDDAVFFADFIMKDDTNDTK